MQSRLSQRSLLSDLAGCSNNRHAEPLKGLIKAIKQVHHPVVLEPGHSCSVDYYGPVLSLTSSG